MSIDERFRNKAMVREQSHQDTYCWLQQKLHQISWARWEIGLITKSIPHGRNSDICLSLNISIIISQTRDQKNRRRQLRLPQLKIRSREKKRAGESDSEYGWWYIRMVGKAAMPPLRGPRRWWITFVIALLRPHAMDSINQGEKERKKTRKP